MIALLRTLAVVALGLVQGVAVPKNDGWVTDLAHLLSPEQERALEALCESYHAGTKRDVALLTVPDLGGQPIERYAIEVARAWKMGATGADDAALLVVSKDDRKLRIEVGRMLEDKLTDALSGRIIRDVIAPRFKAGDFYGGLRGGLEAMHAAIGGDYAPVERARSSHGSPLPGLFFMIAFAILMIALARRRRRHGGWSSGVGPFWIGSMIGRSLGGGGGFGGGGSSGGFGGFGGGGGGFGGFGGGGGGFRGGGASGGW